LYTKVSWLVERGRPGAHCAVNGRLTQRENDSHLPAVSAGLPGQIGSAKQRFGPLLTSDH
jgi:hypothetical protein